MQLHAVYHVTMYMYMKMRDTSMKQQPKDKNNQETSGRQQYIVDGIQYTLFQAFKKNE